MGCSGSKSDDLPLVVRCRERKELIRAAVNNRYALAAAHVSYFRSLKEVGDALRKFVDEELITNSTSSSSSFSSPSLALPPNSKGKHSIDELEYDEDEIDDESHINLSDSSSEDDSDHHHHHNHNDTHNVPKGFNNEQEMPGFNVYNRQGFGGGMMNDPYENPYSYPYQPPYQQQQVPPYQQQQVPPYQQQVPPYGQQVPPYGQQFMDPWFYSNNNSGMYYMKKSAPATRTVIQEQPEPGYGYSDSYWTTPPAYGYGQYSMGSNGAQPVYGYYATGNDENVKFNKPKEAPPPPSPKASAWDFFNPFEELGGGGGGGGYSSYYSNVKYGYGSNYSSPDSNEVREREGIPDLEEETENEMYKDAFKGKRMKPDVKISSRANMKAPRSRKREGVSRSVPMSSKSEHSSGSVPWSSSGELEKPSMQPPEYEEEVEKPSMSPHYKESGNPINPPPMQTQYSEEGVKASSQNNEGKSREYHQFPNEMEGSVCFTDDDSSPEISQANMDEGSIKKKGVPFEMEGTSISRQDAGESSVLSSVTLLSPHGNRDLREVVAEIRDEFETASTYGKEVATMLEIGKMPYEPGFLKVLLSRIFYMVSPSMSLQDPSLQTGKQASKTMQSAQSYFEDVGKDVNAKACNLSSVLEKLYAWEKKLYKEVKAEERLRILYEKKCKRLKMMITEGADFHRYEPAQVSVRRLVTKLDISIKKITAISSGIHKLRDEELQPQVTILIHGLIRMWKAMLKCHKKQFQAIMDSKMRKLRANTTHQIDSTSNATTKLERELRIWCESFNDWIRFQKSYVESLNKWLLQCIDYKPEHTPDGPAPYSPGQLGAPPIFVVCNDWKQALDAIPEKKVSNAMNTFATTLHQLWEKQDEEGRQRLKKEYLREDYEKELKMRRMAKGKLHNHERDTGSDRPGLSVVQSDSGVSGYDDLKVDLDSMRERYDEERKRHKDAMKLVHDAASSSLQGGLVPIFKALESFSMEALKAHEHVRLERDQE